MVSRLSRLIILGLMLTIGLPSWAANFSAHVDRNEVNEQDIFTLVLRYDAQAILKEPNIKALEKDFRIVNQQRSQQYSSVNGKTESFTSWIINLTPLSTGKLTIPSIRFDGQDTDPIEINVLPLSEETKQQAEQDFFFETKVEPETGLVVQGQILYTEKLYFRYQHDNASLSELKVTDARVQQLGDVRRYSTVINGVQFGVYERQFAIFPDVSGELVIPGTRFNGSMVDRYSWGRGTPIKAVAKPIHLTVAPIASNYPSNAAWLPSRKLVLEEQFSVPPSQWQTGEAVTRTLTIRAQGIAGSQLPTIQLPIVDGVRYYPDQAKTQDMLNNFGLVGSSEQAIAMVVTKSGELVLPEVRIPWWNIDTQQLEYASLPARTIQVKAAKGVSETTVGTNNPQSIMVNPTADGKPVLAPNAQPQSSWFWLVVGGLAISLLLNLVLLLRLHKTSAQPTNTRQQPAADKGWPALQSALNGNNLVHIRQQLLFWVNHGGFAHLPLQRPVTRLTVLAEQVKTPELADMLLALDSALFAPASSAAFNTKQLLQLIKQEKKLTATTNAKTSELYPQ